MKKLVSSLAAGGFGSEVGRPESFSMNGTRQEEFMQAVDQELFRGALKRS